MIPGFKRIFIFCNLFLIVLSFPYQAGAGEKNVLRFSMYESTIGTTDDGTLDPLRTFQMLYFYLQHQIFETLATIDFNTQHIIPVLAERWEKINPTTMRFYLRQGVRFHNGEPFTAEAVQFSLNLMRDPRNKFSGRFLFDSIAAVQIIDTYTVDIVLYSTDALLLRKLASIGFIFPPKYYAKVGDKYFTRYPMGTGPFRFLYNTKDEKVSHELHFVANEDYWERPRGNVHELIYTFIPHDHQWKALSDGKIDLLISQDPDVKDKIESKSSLKIVKHPSLRTSFCLMNIDKPGPLTDIRVRRALQHAINRTEIIKKALNGYGMPLFTIAPVGSLSYKAGKPFYDENQTAAKELLARAGYAQGLTLSVMAAQNQPTIDVVNMIKKQLAEAGVTLEVTFLNRDDIKKEIVEPKLMGSSTPSKFDLWILNGWPDIFGTNAQFYFLFLHSRGIFNFGIHMNNNSPVDELYAKAVASKDDKNLSVNIQRLDRYTIEQSLAIPLYQVELIYAMDKKVNFNPGLNDLPLCFKDFSLSDAPRVKAGHPGN